MPADRPRRPAPVHALPAPAPVPPPAPPPPVAAAGRGRGLAVSFVLMVLLPLAAAAAYLATVARPQFESTVAFSVRREDGPMSTDTLLGFAGLSGTGSKDADILYAYLGSQDLVAALDRRLDLAGHYAAPRAADPVFAFDPAGTVEDLVGYWGRMTRLSYDAGTGLIELRVRAFDADTAQVIAGAAFALSTALVNDLSAIARDDMLAQAETQLDLARTRLREARAALTAFRTETQIVDPGADVSGQMGLLTQLQGELAHELIRLDLLAAQTGEGDPRVVQARQRIAVIEARIGDERRKIGAGADGGARDFARVMADFERLSVDVEFARETYLAASAGLDAARAEARRQTRYLAAHIRPTRAERATAPDPVVILGLGALFLGLIWAVAALGWASLRDRS